MYKFSKTPDPENPFDHTEVTVTTSAEMLDDLLTAFEDFLRGNGFRFDGNVEIVENELGEK
jgi:hypothetical protein